MTTSANMTYYGVYRDGKLVKEHSQHAYCKPRVRAELAKYMPPEGCLAVDTGTITMIARWPDEEEEDHFSVPMPLADYLAGKKLVWEDI